MAKAAVAELFRAAQKDPALRETLNASLTLEIFIEKAKQYGYEFTADEWHEMTRFSVEEQAGQLSEIPGL